MGMYDFESYVPESQNLSPEQKSNARMQGFVGLLDSIAQNTAPHFGTTPPKTLLQMVTGGMQGFGQGANAYVHNIPNVNKANLENTQAQLAMQYMKSNPFTGAGGTDTGGSNGQIGSMVPGSNTPVSALNTYSRQMMGNAYASGDPKQIMEGWKSVFENDPVLKGQQTQQQQVNTFQKTPQGTYSMPSMQQPAPQQAPSAPTGLSSFYNSPVQQTPLPPIPSSPVGAGYGAPPMPTQSPQVPPGAGAANVPLNDIPPVQAASLAPPGGPPPPPNPGGSNEASVALDGKPFNPNLKGNVAAPDPSGTPRYNTENTETGISQTKTFQPVDVAADAKIGESANNSQQMLSRIHDMVDAYKSGQAGTLIAQDPELAQKLIAAGVITNKGTVKNVAAFQRASADQMVEILNQIKAATAGTSQSRILNSEIQGLSARMADPKQQPEAVRDILAMAEGLGNYNQDMARGWEAQGGLGNRAANGFTQRPDAYQLQFSLNHNLDDYVNQAKQNMGALKGMDSEAAPVPGAKRAPDNNWYLPDPKRPGKYLRVVQ